MVEASAARAALAAVTGAAVKVAGTRAVVAMVVVKRAVTARE